MVILHGGSIQAHRTPRYFEKDINLAIGLYLGDLLDRRVPKLCILEKVMCMFHF